jgi:indolepyruvate ferredoxin oxidoreductase beta subunit
MLDMAKRFSRRATIADFAAVATRAGSPLNAVLLGAIATSDVLPIAPDAFRAAIRAEGKAVDANLRGFEAGLGAMGSDPMAPSAAAEQTRMEGLTPPHTPSHALAPFHPEAHAVLTHAIERLTDYQDAAYASRYLARVARFVGKPGADGAFIRELGRHLAVRMSVEDVIRVAQLKLREARLVRVAREAKARAGDIVDVTEYLKPGPEEVFGLLPPWLGRWALARVRHDRAWPLKVTTTRLSGFLRLKVLAGLRRWRPRTLRFAEEEAWVARWLDLVERTLAVDAAAAREVVATASLVRGYSDTYKRGLANWTTIMERVVEPMLVGELPRVHFADAVLQARLAAAKDPEGCTLAETIAAIARTASAPGKIAAE